MSLYSVEGENPALSSDGAYASILSECNLLTCVFLQGMHVLIWYSIVCFKKKISSVFMFVNYAKWI